MSLTQQQIIFLRMVQSGSATHNLKNKTAQFLKKKGLISFSTAFGWLLTNDGSRVLKELTAKN